MPNSPLKIKLQLPCGDAYAMGPGKADLLEAIDHAGSISAAARALGMSYRRAWLLVDEMNRCFEKRLVETLSGGGRERGARVTDDGRSVLVAYRILQRQAAQLAATDAFAEMARLVRDVPRTASPVRIPRSD